MVSKTLPENFSSRFEVVSCYVEWDNKILLLHRHADKSQGGKWGVPAGKVDPSEEVLSAMIREAREETGLKIEPYQLQYLEKVFVRYPDYDFVYHMFRYTLEAEPLIAINPKEHLAFCWVNPKEALALSLVDGTDECIRRVYSDRV